jgi:hypothetical protein
MSTISIMIYFPNNSVGLQMLFNIAILSLAKAIKQLFINISESLVVSPPVDVERFRTLLTIPKERQDIENKMPFRTKILNYIPN